MYTELSKGARNKQTETMACSNSTANTMEICKQDTRFFNKKTIYLPEPQFS